MHSKMDVSQRAKIFAPYDALKGFKEALKEKEEVKVLRKDLSEDQLEELSIKFQNAKGGNLVSVTYYDEKISNYVILKGILTEIDEVSNRIRIVKEYIYMKNVINFDIIEENGIKKEI